MLSPSTTPEEQIFLQGLEQRDDQLFEEIMGIVNLTRRRLGDATTMDEVRIALAGGSDAIRGLQPRYERKYALATSDIHKVDAILTRMAKETIARIRKTYD